MNSTKEDQKSQAQQKRNEKPTVAIDDFLQQFRKNGISALAQLDKDEQAQVINWAQDLVNRFGSILRDTPTKIKSLVDLPCPKEDLKIAIKVLLPAYLAKGSDDTVTLLKDRYVCLSTFQEIDHEDKNAITKEANRSDQKLKSTEFEMFSKYYEYMAISISEQKILHDDINTFIDNLQIQKSILKS
jgi:hypothetical protein